MLFRSNTPAQQNVKTIVDLGANIGVFSLLSRRVFPNAIVHAIEADPKNFEILKKNTENDSKIKIYNLAILGDNCPSEVTLARSSYNNGGSFIKEALPPDGYPFEVEETYSIQASSIHKFLIENWINYIDLMKIDVEGSERAIFSCLGHHDWFPKICWFRFEWHGRDLIDLIKNELKPTHEAAFIDEGHWNGLGIAHRR